MTLEVQAIGVQCNLSCPHCYQTALRDGGHAAPAPYDLAAMQATLARQLAGMTTKAFTLFGGEALLMPFDDLAALIRWGVEDQRAQVSLQTNATLITDAHVALFRQYRVGVGISVDGPGACNDSRWAGSVEKTREMTARTDAAIRTLAAVGRPPSLIVTLWKGNVAPDRRPRLMAWLRELRGLGITAIRIHLLEVDHPDVRAHMVPDDADLRAALDDLMTLQADPDLDLTFDLFDDMLALLKGEDARVSCVWNACDPFTTAAVQAVDPTGALLNCGRTDGLGVPWLKADRPMHERQLALHATPMDHGGCQGCRFFALCKGYCPGTAIDRDWRQRTEHCATLLWLFERLERLLVFQGVVPVSRDPQRPAIEGALLAAWAEGRTLGVGAARTQVRTGKAPAPRLTADGHGDVPHGDSHGDHYDGARAR